MILATAGWQLFWIVKNGVRYSGYLRGTGSGERYSEVDDQMWKVVTFLAGSTAASGE
jgi:hypothetical protein